MDVPLRVWVPPVLDLWLGVANEIMAARRAQQARWRAANPEKARARIAAWKAAHPERFKAQQRAYEEANWDRKLARGKTWNQVNRARKAELRKAWRAANPDRTNELARSWQKRRRDTDPAYRILVTLRNRVNTAVSRAFTKKAGRTAELLGASVEFVRAHLEKQFKPGMTWDNYGDWHIDHVRPCAGFNLVDPNEQRRCFHFSNLQPLWAAENLSKGDRIIDAA